VPIDFRPFLSRVRAAKFIGFSVLFPWLFGLDVPEGVVKLIILCLCLLHYTGFTVQLVSSLSILSSLVFEKGGEVDKSLCYFVDPPPLLVSEVAPFCCDPAFSSDRVFFLCWWRALLCVLSNFLLEFYLPPLSFLQIAAIHMYHEFGFLLSPSPISPYFAPPMGSQC